MPTTLDSKTEQTARTRRPTECEPLLHAATKDLLRNNSFRITGLPLEATPRQVAKHLAKLAQMAELGLAAPHYAAVFALNPPPTLDQIRDAAQRLSDPEKRLVDELFWFWPCEPGAAASDPALQALASGNADAALKTWSTHETNPTTSAAAMHNIALFWQLTATESEPASATDPELPQQQTLEKHWRRSLDRWEYLTSDEKFWDMVNAHARRIDETRLTTGFVSRMRSTLPLALARINAELALNHAQGGRKSVARMHVQLIRDATNGAAILDKAADLVFAPTTARLRAHIDSTRKIAQESPEAAANAVRDLLAQASPTAPLFNLFYGVGQHTPKDLLDEVATTCIGCLVSYQKKTHDNQGFVNLLQRALPLAQLPETRQRIETNIRTGKENLAFTELQPFFDKLKNLVDRIEPVLATRFGLVTDSQSKFKAICAEFLPVLAELKKKHGATSPAVACFSDNLTVALRGVALKACERDSAFRTASDILKLCQTLCCDPELKACVASDLAAVNDILGEGTCYYCETNQGVASATVKVTMHQITSIDSEGTRYKHTTVKIPRCKHCQKVHNRPWTLLWRGAVPAGILATFLIPMLIGPWEGSRLQGVIINALIGAFIGGTIAFFVAEQLIADKSQVKPKAAGYGSDFGCLPGLRGLGIGRAQKRAHAFRRVAELHLQRWHFGSKPKDQTSNAISSLHQLGTEVVGAIVRLVLRCPLRPPWSPNATWIGLTIILLATAIFYSPIPPPPPATDTQVSPLPMATAPLTARPYTPAPTPAASPFSAPNFATPPAISTKRTYTVPRSVAADLDSAKQQINIEKAKASALDTQLATAKQAVQDQRERVAEFQSRQQTLARQIDLDRINLDRSSQADVDTFNSNVNVYNTLLRTVRSENATANELIDAYNTLLEEAKAQDHVVNQLVDSYNATLRLNRR